MNSKLTYFICIAIGLSCNIRQLSRGTQPQTYHAEEPVDTIKVRVCIRSQKDSLPTEAIIGFTHGNRKVLQYNDNQGCATFYIVPKEWTYFEVYSDRLKGIYEINPFRYVRKGPIDTIIYLSEYEVRSDKIPKH
jgi:hypothetical protein